MNRWVLRGVYGVSITAALLVMWDGKAEEPVLWVAWGLMLVSGVGLAWELDSEKDS